MRTPLIFWLAVAVAGAALGVGCGSAPSSSPTVTPEPKLDPRAALRRATTQLLELESAAFTLEHLAGNTTLFPGLVMTKASGVVDIPDKVRLRVEAESSMPRSYVEINVVTIGDRAYMTDIFSGQWRQVPVEYLPVSFSQLGQTLAGIVEAVEDPLWAGSLVLKGRNTLRISGHVPSQALASLVPGAAAGLDVGLELRLDQGDGLLRQVLIKGPVVPGDIPDAVRLLTLDGINLPVDIVPPG